jgi:hypothetical protein
MSDLLKQVGELKTDAKNLMIEFLNNPEKLNIKNITDILITGSQPAGARNIKIPAMKGKTTELETETRRMAVHVEVTATNNLKTLQENLKDGPLSLEISRPNNRTFLISTNTHNEHCSTTTRATHISES